MEIQVIQKVSESKGLVKFIDDMFEHWLESSAFAKENACCPGRTKKQIIEKIDNIENNNYEFLIATTEQERVVAMLYMSHFDDGSAYLGLINVHPDFRNNKIFKTLLARAEEECRIRGTKYMRLRTWNENEVALAAFSKSGFVVWERQDSFVVLRKDLI